MSYCFVGDLAPTPAEYHNDPNNTLDGNMLFKSLATALPKMGAGRTTWIETGE